MKAFCPFGFGLALISFGFAHTLSADPTAFYDELRDAEGNLRPQYQNVWPGYEELSPTERREFRKQSLKDFKGDNALSPLPRVLSASEGAELKAGVEQRGEALRRFLEDHYSGNKTYLNTVIPEPVITRILQRTNEDLYAGQIDPKRIFFPYGPDIIRDSAGVWRVLEDNPGFIGGPGDLHRARQTLLENSPGLAEKLGPIDDPSDYYEGTVKALKQWADPKSGQVVIYQIPPYADNEDLRIRDIYKKLGVTVVTPNTDTKIVSTPKGLFLQSPAQNSPGSVVRKRIGMLMMNGEHHWMDATDPTTQQRALLAEVREWLDEKLKPAQRETLEKALQSNDGLPSMDTLKKALNDAYLFDSVNGLRHRRIPNLIKHWQDGKVQLNYTPGVDFIGDKEFNVYVEDLVRHYLKEEPILKNIPTHPLASFKDGKAQLDEATLKKVMSNKDNYVIKQVDGRGGDGIWVGPKVSDAEWKKAEAAVRASPDRFLAQEYKHLSTLDDMIVDLRMLSLVTPTGTFVSPTPWGRGIPLSGDGKVNLSKAGVEVPIVVQRADCVGAWERLPQALVK